MAKRYGTPGPRSLDPEICRDAGLGRCSIGAQLLFDRLVLQADDQGRLHGSAAAVRGLCVPLVREATIKRIDSWLGELATARLIRRYKAAEFELVQIESWWQDQAGMRRAYASRWPAPQGWGDRVYGLPSDDRPGTLAGEAAKARSAGNLPPFAANCDGGSASAHAHAPADVPTKTRTKGSPIANSDSAHQRFIEFWSARFHEEKGAPYAFQGARDGKHVKEILTMAGGDLERAKEVALVLLGSTDTFYVEKGVDLGLLRSQWNKLASAGRGRGRSNSKPAGAAYHTFVPPTDEGGS